MQITKYCTWDHIIFFCSFDTPFPEKVDISSRHGFRDKCSDKRNSKSEQSPLLKSASCLRYYTCPKPLIFDTQRDSKMPPHYHTLNVGAVCTLFKACKIYIPEVGRTFNRYKIVFFDTAKPTHAIA